MECSNWIKLVWWKCLFHIRRTKHVKWQLFRPLPSAPPQPLFLVSSLGSLLNINPQSPHTPAKTDCQDCQKDIPPFLERQSAWMRKQVFSMYLRSSFFSISDMIKTRVLKHQRLRDSINQIPEDKTVIYPTGQTFTLSPILSICKGIGNIFVFSGLRFWTVLSYFTCLWSI